MGGKLQEELARNVMVKYSALGGKMPAKMRKLPGKRLYRVTDNKGKIHAFGTTKRKAEAQVRILNNLR